MKNISLGGIIYLIIGIIVAFNKGYIANGTHNLAGLISALLAIFLWPLVLFGANLHLVFSIVN